MLCPRPVPCKRRRAWAVCYCTLTTRASSRCTAWPRHQLGSPPRQRHTGVPRNKNAVRDRRSGDGACRQRGRCARGPEQGGAPEIAFRGGAASAGAHGHAPGSAGAGGGRGARPLGAMWSCLECARGLPLVCTTARRPPSCGRMTSHARGTRPLCMHAETSTPAACPPPP